jgi:hypothetical protein
MVRSSKAKKARVGRKIINEAEFRFKPERRVKGNLPAAHFTVCRGLAREISREFREDAAQAADLVNCRRIGAARGAGRPSLPNKDRFRTKIKGAAGWIPSRPIFRNSLVQALRAPSGQALTGLAGDPSEVTALEIRHWITSFRC